MENSQRLKMRSPAEEVKLAAAAISHNVRLRSSDMPTNIQEHAMRCARSLVDSAPKRRPNLTHLARTLKKEFDSEYGPAWHCVVGTSFGSFVTHSPVESMEEIRRDVLACELKRLTEFKDEVVRKLNLFNGRTSPVGAGSHHLLCGCSPGAGVMCWSPAHSVYSVFMV